LLSFFLRHIGEQQQNPKQQWLSSNIAIGNKTILHIAQAKNIFGSKRWRHGFGPQNISKMRVEGSQKEDCKDTRHKSSKILQWRIFWDECWS